MPRQGIFTEFARFDEVRADSLSVDKDNIVLNGTTDFITVTSSAPWQMTGVPSWLTPNQTTGSGASDTVTFTAEEYTGRDDREATLTLELMNGSPNKVIVVVTQSGVGLVFTKTGSTTINLTAAGGTTAISGTSNGARFVATVPTTGVTYTTLVANSVNYPLSGTGAINEIISGDPGANAVYDYTLNISVAANTSVTNRELTFTISSGSAPTVTITVVQAGTAPTISVTPTTLTLDGSAVSQADFDITSNTTWALDVSNVDYANATPLSGTGNATIHITASPNASGIDKTGVYTVNTTSGTPVASATVSITLTAGTPPETGE